jgi:RNA polymerase sigma-70 factor (ECF subfamily)
MYFPTTQWNLLAQASLTAETGARQALEELCRRYWFPLHQFIRLRGYSETEAQDLTQDFLVHLLERSTLQKADRDRGRFRSFLLGALVRFLADEYDRRRAQKRGQGVVHLSLDSSEVSALSSSDPSVLMFDREWALVILEHALQAIEHEFQQSGKAAKFKLLRQFLPGSVNVPSYDDAAAELGVGLPALKSDIHRTRQRFKELVRQEIATTVSAPHEVDDELKYLQQVLLS